MPQEDQETSTLLVDGFMVKPCGLTSALVVVELFPPESINMRVCSSIDWVYRDIFGMKTLGGNEFDFCNKIFVVTDM